MDELTSTSERMNKLYKGFTAVNVDINKASKTLTWFTDGACSKNGSKNSVGGFAAICTNGYKVHTLLYGKVDDREFKSTNIRAEGIAIMSVFEYLKRHIDSDKWDKTVIYSDSEFWVKMLYNYMPSWTLSKFDQKANSDLTKKIYAIWKDLQRSDKKIEVVHIYGHNKDNSKTSPDPAKRYCHDNNLLADMLAGIAQDLPDYDIRREKLF